MTFTYSICVLHIDNKSLHFLAIKIVFLFQKCTWQSKMVLLYPGLLANHRFNLTDIPLRCHSHFRAWGEGRHLHDSQKAATAKMTTAQEKVTICSHLQAPPIQVHFNSFLSPSGIPPQSCSQLPLVLLHQRILNNLWTQPAKCCTFLLCDRISVNPLSF